MRERFLSVLENMWSKSQVTEMINSNLFGSVTTVAVLGEITHLPEIRNVTREEAEEAILEGKLVVPYYMFKE